MNGRIIQTDDGTTYKVREPSTSFNAKNALARGLMVQRK